MADEKHRQLEYEIEIGAQDLLEGEGDDDLLRLVFTACHPVLPPEAQVALTLRLVGGLTTEEIARAFLVPVSTMAERRDLDRE